MQKDLDNLLEELLRLEDNPDWGAKVDSFISSTCELSTEHSEMPSPHPFNLERNATMKDTIGLFIRKYMMRFREFKEIINFQNDDIRKLKSELVSVRDENEQLNEVSLALISEVKKLNKYVKESDIFVSILRGEIYKQKHQNKMLVNALKQLYEGNEELATKILQDAFFQSPEKTSSPPEKVLTSPESTGGASGRRFMSLMDDALLSGLNNKMKLRASVSTFNRRKPFLEELSEPNKRYIATEEAFSPGIRQTSIILHEYEEYEQNFQFENEVKENREGIEDDPNVLYSFEEAINETSDKNGSVILGRLSTLVSKSPSETRSPAKMSPKVPRIKNLLTLNKVLKEKLCKEDIDFTVSEPYSLGKGEIEEMQFPIIPMERVSKWLIPENTTKLSMKSSK